MSLTKMEADLKIISKLEDEPNDTQGLSAAALKAKFDEAGEAIQGFINNNLIPDIEHGIAELGRADRAIEEQISLLDPAGGIRSSGGIEAFVYNEISNHNTDGGAHSDIRKSIADNASANDAAHASLTTKIQQNTDKINAYGESSSASLTEHNQSESAHAPIRALIESLKTTIFNRINSLSEAFNQDLLKKFDKAGGTIDGDVSVGGVVTAKTVTGLNDALADKDAVPFGHMKEYVAASIAAAGGGGGSGEIANPAYRLILGAPIVQNVSVSGTYTVQNGQALTNGDLYWLDCLYAYNDGRTGGSKMVGKVESGSVKWNNNEIVFSGTQISFINKIASSVFVTIAKVLEFTKLDQPFSDIEGNDNIASGSHSHVEGFETQATNWNAHAEGRGTIASGPNSHAQGRMSKATAAGSHAEGYVTVSSGNYGSHAEGNKTVASGQYGSHAEGNRTVARGNYGSHAEGHKTTASGLYGSHAEGQATTSSGASSHAEGNRTSATASFSHAEGSFTIAASKNQHVQGKYNIEDGLDEYAHIVGNGDPNHRSNAHTIDWKGNAWFAGSVKDGTGRALVAKGTNGAVSVENGGTGRVTIVDTAPSVAKFRASAILLEANKATPSQGVINWYY